MNLRPAARALRRLADELDGLLEGASRGRIAERRAAACSSGTKYG